MFATLINDLLSTVLSLLIKFIVKWIIRPILWFSYEITKAIVVFYLYQVGVLMLTILDFVEDMFRMMAGLKDGMFINNLTNYFTGAAYGPGDGDLLFQLITSTQILQIFASIFTVGVFMIIVTTLMAVVKQELNMQKANNKLSILKTSFRAMLYMLLVPVITMFGVFLSNSILQLVDIATGGANTTVSGTVFVSACYDAFYEGEWKVKMTDPYTSAISNVLSRISAMFNGDSDAGRVEGWDDTGGTPAGAGNELADHRQQILDAYRMIDQHDKVIPGVANNGYRVYYNVGIVSEDFNGGKINYVIWYFFGIVLLKTYISAIFGLVERLYKAVLLFLVMPGMIGLMPLDEGQAFGSWRKQFISEVLGVFGMVIGMNLFLFMAPIASSLQINYTPTNLPDAEYYATNGHTTRYESLIKMLFNRNITLNILTDKGIDGPGAVNMASATGFATLIIQNIFIMVGALMINKLSSTISSILGGGDVLSAGKGMQGDFMKSAAGGARFGAAVTMGGLSATRFIAPKIGAGLKNFATSGYKNHALPLAMSANFAKNGEFGLAKATLKNYGSYVGGRFKKVGSSIKDGAKSGAGFVKNVGATLGTSFETGAIFSPAAMKNLYYARKDERKAQADLDSAVASGDQSAIDKATAAHKEKEKLLNDKIVSSKGAAAINMEMSLQMGKDALKDLIPGSGLVDKFKKNVDTARNDTMGGNAISSDLKNRINKMKQDAADKKAEKKFADVLGAYGRSGYGSAVNNILERMRKMQNEQTEAMQSLSSKIDDIFEGCQKGQINEEQRIARMAEIMSQAASKGLDIETFGDKNIKPQIKPRIDLSEIGRLEALEKISDTKAFDSQLKAILADWNKSQSKALQNAAKIVEDGIEEYKKEMESQKQKGKK